MEQGVHEKNDSKVDRVVRGLPNADRGFKSSHAVTLIYKATDDECRSSDHTIDLTSIYLQ